MRRTLGTILAAHLALVFGCAGINDFMAGGPRVVTQAQPVRHVGPKITVVVAPIENRTGVSSQTQGTGTTVQTGSAAAPPDKVITQRDPIGTGMRDQLITALTQTGAFSVMRGRAPGSGARPAEYLIEGAVTEYEPSSASIAGGYGWGLSPIRRISDPTVSPGNVFSQVLSPNAIGGLGQQDHIAMNIHIVRIATDEIVASTTIEATPRALGGALNLLFGASRRIVDVGGQVKAPMQKAIRACMIQAAAWATESLALRPVGS